MLVLARITLGIPAYDIGTYGGVPLGAEAGRATDESCARGEPLAWSRDAHPRSDIDSPVATATTSAPKARLGVHGSDGLARRVAIHLAGAP